MSSGGAAASKYDDDDFDDFEGSDEDDQEAQSMGTAAPSGSLTPVGGTPSGGPSAAAAPKPVPKPMAKPGPVPMPTASAGAAAAPTDAQEAIRQALESGMWKEQVDPNSKKKYYYHVVTKKTTWDLAAELGVKPAPVPMPKRSVGGALDSDASSTLSESGLPTLKLPDKILARSQKADSVDVGGPTLEAPMAQNDTPRSDESEDAVALEVQTKFNSSTAVFDSFVAFNSPGTGPGKEWPDRASFQSDSRGVPSSRPSVQSPMQLPQSDGGAEADASSVRPTVSVPPAISTITPVSVDAGKKSLTPSSTPGLEKGAGSSSQLLPLAMPGSLSEKPSTTNTTNNTAIPTPGKQSDSSSLFSTASAAVEDVAEKKKAELERLQREAAEEMVRQRKQQEEEKDRLEAQKRQLEAKPFASGATTAAAAAASVPVASPTEAKPVASHPLGSLLSRPDSTPTVGLVSTKDEQGRTPVAGAPIAAIPQQVVTMPQAGGAYAVPDAATSSRLAELHETTDAIERLVRAYATLKHPAAAASAGPQRRPVPMSAGSPAEIQRMRDSAPIGWGADSSTFLDTSDEAARTRIQRLQYRRNVSGEKETVSSGYMTDRSLAGELTRMQANEALLDEEICDMVIQMMLQENSTANHRTRKAGAAATSGAFVDLADSKVNRGSAKAAAGPVEHVTIDSHRAYTADAVGYRSIGSLSSRVRTGGTGKAPGLDDGIAGMDAESLQTMLEQNLHRYVLKHVASGSVPAYFARLAIIDMIAVVTDAVRYPGAFVPPAGVDPSAASDAAQEANILLVYEGPVQCGPGAAMRTFCDRLVQALPFEIVNPTAEDKSGKEATLSTGRPSFRLEYWVTREKLWAIAGALTVTLRRIEHIVNDQYEPFRSTGAPARKAGHADPSPQPSPDAPFYITEFPLFSLMPLRPAKSATTMTTKTSTQQGAASKLAAAFNPTEDQRAQLLQKRRHLAKRFDIDPDCFFGLSQDQVESVAFATSTIALEVLEDVTRADKNAARNKQSSGEAEVDDGMTAQQRLDEADEEDKEELMRRQRRREVVDDIVADTVAELLMDDGIRAAIKRRATAKIEETYRAPKRAPAATARSQSPADQGSPSGEELDEREKNARRIEMAQAKADNMIRRLKEELQM